MWCFLQNSRTSAPGDFATGRMVHRAASGFPGHHRARAGGPRSSHNRLILGVEPFFPSPHPTPQRFDGLGDRGPRKCTPPQAPTGVDFRPPPPARPRGWLIVTIVNSRWGTVSAHCVVSPTRTVSLWTLSVLEICCNLVLHSWHAECNVRSAMLTGKSLVKWLTVVLGTILAICSSSWAQVRTPDTDSKAPRV